MLLAKKILNVMHGFKSAILAEWKNCQNGTFEPMHEIQNFFGQETFFEALWKCHIQKISITCSRVCQILDLGQSKYKLRLFSKRTHGISKILFNLGSCEFLARLEGKIRKCLFFNGSLLYKHSVPLQGTFCDTGIPRTFYGGKNCSVSVVLDDLDWENKLYSLGWPKSSHAVSLIKEIL